MKTIIAIVVLLASALSSGCGGGGGGGGNVTLPPPPPPAPPPVGGIARTGFALGSITSFGSVVVNGVHYDTDNAEFTIDGQPALQSDLSVGQVISIKGSIDDNLTTGTADSVAFDDLVKGPISAIDVALNQIVVLGQTVRFGPTTSFDNNISTSSIDGLAIDMLVEVSGFIAADGSIEVSRIEAKPAGSPFEVHGNVSNLDSANFRFSLNALIVDYSGAVLDDNFPGGQITEGDFVEAKDEGPGAALGAAGELLATKVEFENTAIEGEAGTHVEVEGLITGFVSAQEFNVAGTPVTTNASTVYEGGVEADLVNNVKVEVEGDLDANNVIVAEKVDIRRSKIIRATAIVDVVTPASNSLEMLGITFTVDEMTRFEDKSDADISPLTIDDIAIGDYLEIRGGEFPADSGQILATILEREDVDTDTILQGFVASLGDPTMTILGVTITTNSSTVFRDVDDSVLTSAEFFSLVAIDSIVKAKGIETTETTITATEVQLELEI